MLLMRLWYYWCLVTLNNTLVLRVLFSKASALWKIAQGARKCFCTCRLCLIRTIISFGVLSHSKTWSLCLFGAFVAPWPSYILVCCVFCCLVLPFCENSLHTLVHAPNAFLALFVCSHTFKKDFTLLYNGACCCMYECACCFFPIAACVATVLRGSPLSLTGGTVPPTPSFRPGPRQTPRHPFVTVAFVFFFSRQKWIFFFPCRILIATCC